MKCRRTVLKNGNIFLLCATIFEGTSQYSLVSNYTDTCGGCERTITDFRSPQKSYLHCCEWKVLGKLQRILCKSSD